MTQNKANAEPRFRRESHNSGTSLSFFATKTQVHHKSQLVSQTYAVAGEGSAPWGTNGQRSRKQVGTEEWKVRGIKLSQVRIKSPQSSFFYCQSCCGVSMCVGFHSLKWSWYHYHLSFLNSSIDIAKNCFSNSTEVQDQTIFLSRLSADTPANSQGWCWWCSYLWERKQSQGNEFWVACLGDVGKAQILPQRSLPLAVSRAFPEEASWHEDVGPGTVPGVTGEPFLA